MAKNKTFNPSFSSILLEAFFVVLGVVLAFAAHEWREQKNRENQAASARQGIIEEIRANREAVQQANAYHLALIGKLSKLSNSATPPGIQTFSRGFISPASILTTAWDAARETDTLRDMAYEDVLLFSKLYQEQERYEGQSQSMGQIIYAEMFNHGKAGILTKHAHLRDIIATFIYRERNLLTSYDQALSRLGSPEES